MVNLSKGLPVVLAFSLYHFVLGCFSRRFFIIPRVARMRRTMDSFYVSMSRGCVTVLNCGCIDSVDRRGLGFVEIKPRRVKC